MASLPTVHHRTSDSLQGHWGLLPTQKRQYTAPKTIEEPLWVDITSKAKNCQQSSDAQYDENSGDA